VDALELQPSASNGQKNKTPHVSRVAVRRFPKKDFPADAG